MLHRGTKVAKITTVDSSVIGGISQQEKSIPTQNLEDIAPAKQELLWKLVEKNATNLNNHAPAAKTFYTALVIC